MFRDRASYKDVYMSNKSLDNLGGKLSYDMKGVKFIRYTTK